jgi:hypothetical protein
MTTLARAVVQAHELLCAPLDRVLANHPTARWLAREAVAFLVALTFVAPLSWVGRNTPFEVWGWVASLAGQVALRWALKEHLCPPWRANDGDDDGNDHPEEP